MRIAWYVLELAQYFDNSEKADRENHVRNNTLSEYDCGEALSSTRINADTLDLA